MDGPQHNRRGNYQPPLGKSVPPSAGSQKPPHNRRTPPGSGIQAAHGPPAGKHPGASQAADTADRRGAQLVGRVPGDVESGVAGDRDDDAAAAGDAGIGPSRTGQFTNLSLGTWLVLQLQSASERAMDNAGTNPNGGPSGLPKSVAERLLTQVDVNFRRTPLSEAFGSIGEDIGVNFKVDGGELKIAGYTKNMPQTFRLLQVPATEALRTILKPYPKMVLVVDEGTNALSSRRARPPNKKAKNR